MAIKQINNGIDHANVLINAALPAIKEAGYEDYDSYSKAHGPNREHKPRTDGKYDVYLSGLHILVKNNGPFDCFDMLFQYEDLQGNVVAEARASVLGENDHNPWPPAVSGPWRRVSDSFGTFIEGDGVSIAKVCISETGQTQSNARLLAASPTMLEALQAVVDSGIDLPKEVRNKVEESISIATNVI